LLKEVRRHRKDFPVVQYSIVVIVVVVVFYVFGGGRFGRGQNRKVAA